MLFHQLKLFKGAITASKMDQSMASISSRAFTHRISPNQKILVKNSFTSFESKLYSIHSTVILRIFLKFSNSFNSFTVFKITSFIDVTFVTASASHVTRKMTCRNMPSCGRLFVTILLQLQILQKW